MLEFTGLEEELHSSCGGYLVYHYLHSWATLSDQDPLDKDKDKPIVQLVTKIRKYRGLKEVIPPPTTFLDDL